MSCPPRFDSIDHARRWTADFLHRYSTEHRGTASCGRCHVHHLAPSRPGSLQSRLPPRSEDETAAGRRPRPPLRLEFSSTTSHFAFHRRGVRVVAGPAGARSRPGTTRRAGSRRCRRCVRERASSGSPTPR
nr:hypothetical protein [Rhodococcus zopfii]